MRGGVQRNIVKREGEIWGGEQEREGERDREGGRERKGERERERRGRERGIANRHGSVGWCTVTLS